MSNKHFSDVRPNRDDKDSCVESLKGVGRNKPATNPSASTFKGPTHARGGAPVKSGGKDLSAPKFTEQQHREPTGELP